MFIFALIKLLFAAHLSHTDHNLLLPLKQILHVSDELLIGEHLQKTKTFLSEQSLSLPKFRQEQKSQQLFLTMVSDHTEIIYIATNLHNIWAASQWIDSLSAEM